MEVVVRISSLSLPISFLTDSFSFDSFQMDAWEEGEVRMEKVLLLIWCWSPLDETEVQRCLFHMEYSCGLFRVILTGNFWPKVLQIELSFLWHTVLSFALIFSPKGVCPASSFWAASLPAGSPAARAFQVSSWPARSVGSTERGKYADGACA